MWEQLPGFPSQTSRVVERALVLESHSSRAHWANGSQFLTSASLVCTKDPPQDRWEDEVGSLRKSSVSARALWICFSHTPEPFPAPILSKRGCASVPHKASAHLIRMLDVNGLRVALWGSE